MISNYDPADFKTLKRSVYRVFIHCSASDRTEDDNVKTIMQWHLARGFNTIGYHFYINKKGVIFTGRYLEHTPAAQEGHNAGSIAICLGGLDHFSNEQFEALKILCSAIELAYLAKRQVITFHGHCEVSNKTCPNFNYIEVLGLDAKGKIKD